MIIFIKILRVKKERVREREEGENEMNVQIFAKYYLFLVEL